MLKLDAGARCDSTEASVYRQSREAGRGCLVGVPAGDANRHPSARDYHWVLGYPAEAREMHPSDTM